MKKEIRLVDEKRGVVQITTTDERWYARTSTDEVTGVPRYAFVPSVTWMTSFYPKGIGYAKWLAEHGFDEAEAIKQAAGDKGSKVHAACTDRVAGKVVYLDQPYRNPSTGLLEPLTVEEYAAVLSFEAWRTATHPLTVACDLVVWNEEAHYAGTVDYVYRLEGQPWLYLDDWKTGKFVWPSYEAQVSAYAHSQELQVLVKDLKVQGVKLGLLQLGYQRNRLGYKHTPVEDQYDIFLACKRIWAKETAGQQPWQRDYPLSIGQPQEDSCAPSAEDGKTTNGSPLTSGSPARLPKSSTTKPVSTT